MTSGLAQAQTEEWCAHRISADGNLPLYRPNPPAHFSFADHEPAFGPVTYVISGTVYIRFYLEFPINNCDIGIDGWLMSIKKSDSGEDFPAAKWDFNPLYNALPIPILYSSMEYDTSYDISVQYENEHGISDPLIVTVRTGSADGSGFDNEKRVFSNPIDEDSWKKFRTFWNLPRIDGHVHTFSTELGPIGSLVGSMLTVSARQGVNLRKCPSTSCAKIMLLATGTEVMVVEGPKEAENYEWYRVLVETDVSTERGWLAHKSLSNGSTFIEEPELDIDLLNSFVQSLDVLDDIPVDTEAALYEDREVCFPDYEGQVFLYYYDRFGTAGFRFAPLQKYLSPDGGACVNVKGIAGANTVIRVADDDAAQQLREETMDDFRSYLTKSAMDALPPAYALGIIPYFIAMDQWNRFRHSRAVEFATGVSDTLYNDVKTGYEMANKAVKTSIDFILDGLFAIGEATEELADSALTMADEAVGDDIDLLVEAIDKEFGDDLELARQAMEDEVARVELAAEKTTVSLNANARRVELAAERTLNDAEQSLVDLTLKIDDVAGDAADTTLEVADVVGDVAGEYLIDETLNEREKEILQLFLQLEELIDETIDEAKKENPKVNFGFTLFGDAVDLACEPCGIASEVFELGGLVQDVSNGRSFTDAFGEILGKIAVTGVADSFIGMSKVVPRAISSMGHQALHLNGQGFSAVLKAGYTSVSRSIPKTNLGKLLQKTKYLKPAAAKIKLALVGKAKAAMLAASSTPINAAAAATAKVLAAGAIARGSTGAVAAILNGEYDEEMAKRREEAHNAREDMLSSLATAGISAQSVKELLATFEQAQATFGVPTQAAVQAALAPQSVGGIAMRTVDNELVDVVIEQVRNEERERREREQERLEEEEQEQREQEEQERREQEEQEQRERELQDRREQEEPEQPDRELQDRRDEVERIAQETIDEVEQEPIEQASTSSLRPGDDYDEHPLPPSTEARTVTVSINSEDGDLQPGFDVWCDGEKVATSQASRSGGATSETVTLRGDCSVSAWSVTGGGRYELTVKEE